VDEKALRFLSTDGNEILRLPSEAKRPPVMETGGRFVSLRVSAGLSAATAASAAGFSVAAGAASGLSLVSASFASDRKGLSGFSFMNLSSALEASSLLPATASSSAAAKALRCALSFLPPFSDWEPFQYGLAASLFISAPRTAATEDAPTEDA
jgi:hypothetical protein